MKNKIEIPEWLTFLNNKSGVSSKEMAKLFGYKNAASFNTAVNRGIFIQPDFISKGLGYKSNQWKKQTVISEIERVNNGIRNAEEKHNVPVIESRATIICNAQILYD